MSTCVRKCTFARACNVGENSLNVVSRTFPHFSQSMLTPMYKLFLMISDVLLNANLINNNNIPRVIWHIKPRNYCRSFGILQPFIIHTLIETLSFMKNNIIS